LNKNKKLDPYLEELLKLYPNISSGRKNYLIHNRRVIKTLIITKKYFKNKIKSNHI